MEEEPAGAVIRSENDALFFHRRRCHRFFHYIITGCGSRVSHPLASEKEKCLRDPAAEKVEKIERMRSILGEIFSTLHKQSPSILFC